MTDLRLRKLRTADLTTAEIDVIREILRLAFWDDVRSASATPTGSMRSAASMSSSTSTGRS